MTRRIAMALGATLLMAVPASAVDVIADAGDEEIFVDCSATDGSSVPLDGTASTVDGSPAHENPDTTFLWEAEGVDFNLPTDPMTTGTFPVGETIVTLTVTHTDATDPLNLIETFDEDEVVVIVEDIDPPTITAVSDPMVLWPPNHKMHEVYVDLVVMDSCDPDPQVVLTDLYSNEPDNGNGDGNTVDDIQEVEIDTDDRVFLLRAERMGGGSGRIYTAEYTATDASGNAGSGMVQISVPHDQGELKAAKAEAKAAQKMAKAAEKAAAKVDKQAAKDAAKAAKEAAKAAKKAAKEAKKAAKNGG
jgi:hypothetical protein